MGWVHKTRLLLHHVSAPFSITSKSSDGGSSRKGSCGLVKLRDDVQSCGYEDVEVMWKILNPSVPDQVGVAAPNTRRRRVPKLRRPPWRSLFLFSSHHSHKTSTASTCASVSSSSSSSSCCFSG